MVRETWILHPRPLARPRASAAGLAHAPASGLETPPTTDLGTDLSTDAGTDLGTDSELYSASEAGDDWESASIEGDRTAREETPGQHTLRALEEEEDDDDGGLLSDDDDDWHADLDSDSASVGSGSLADSMASLTVPDEP